MTRVRFRGGLAGCPGYVPAWRFTVSVTGAPGDCNPFEAAQMVASRLARVGVALDATGTPDWSDAANAPCRLLLVSALTCWPPASAPLPLENLPSALRKFATTLWRPAGRDMAMPVATPSALKATGAPTFCPSTTNWIAP